MNDSLQAMGDGGTLIGAADEFMYNHNTKSRASIRSSMAIASCGAVSFDLLVTEVGHMHRSSDTVVA